jgi:RNA polymerase sigma factor (sigma-70 family)
LFTIARNTVIDHLRKMGRDAMAYTTHRDENDNDLFTFDVSEQPNDGFKDHEERMYWESCCRIISKLLTTLNDLERQFIQLRFVNEMPQREVAKHMNITRWKARTLENKTLKRLREQLNKQPS